MIYAVVCIVLGALVAGFAFGVMWRAGKAEESQRELIAAFSRATKAKGENIAELTKARVELEAKVAELTPVRDHGKYTRRPTKTWAEVKNLAENPPE